jgi:hypothetical protein
MGWTTPEAVAFSLSLPYVNGISGSGNPFFEAYAYYYLSALRNEDPFNWNPPGFLNAYTESNPGAYSEPEPNVIVDRPTLLPQTQSAINSAKNALKKSDCSGFLSGVIANLGLSGVTAASLVDRLSVPGTIEDNAPARGHTGPAYTDNGVISLTNKAYTN